MLIVDTRASTPLIPAHMEWNPDSIQVSEEQTAVIPILDSEIKQVADFFAYEIASNQPWVWPDLNKTTVALTADLNTYSFARFALLVGVQPAEAVEKENEEDWAEFEAARRKAVEENGDTITYQSFPVMLDENEAQAIRDRIFDVLGIF